MAEDLHDRRGEHVHAEEAEIVTGAQAGHDKLLFRLGGAGFFDHGFDLIEPVGAGDASPAPTGSIKSKP